MCVIFDAADLLRVPVVRDLFPLAVEERRLVSGRPTLRRRLSGNTTEELHGLNRDMLGRLVGVQTIVARPVTQAFQNKAKGRMTGPARTSG